MNPDNRESRMARWRRTIREKGVRRLVGDRMRWYRQWFEMDNWLVGRWIELRGNRVRLQRCLFSVRNPLVTTRQKSTIYFSRYEVGERVLVARHLVRDLATIELGGSIGVVACTTNKLLSRPSEHVVVEANPLLVPTLEENRNLNGCQFVVEPAAIAYGRPSVDFAVSDHFLMGRIGGTSTRAVTVPAVTLASLLDKYHFTTINLIADIEGAEADLIENEADVLRRHVKTIVLETHPQFLGADRVSAMLTAARTERLSGSGTISGFCRGANQ